MVDNSNETQELQSVDIGSLDLDIFDLAKRNKRKPTFVIITRRLLADPLRALPQINEGKLTSFLERIQQTSMDYNVSYHNDMHCLDVAQMTYILLQTGDDCLSKQLKLSALEQAAAIIGAACHDYGHDGYNNGYHVKVQSERFALHGETGVQEQYHFAESFKVLQEMQLLAGLGVQDQNVFKKTMYKCIMATDMSRHVNDMNEVKAVCEQIPSGAEILPADLGVEQKDRRRSKILEMVVHASDISFLSRPTQARRTQAYMLFEEFFRQGDKESAQGLPISFLCDRATTNTAKSQSGFMKFAPLPLFKMIGQLCPSKEVIVERLLESGEEFDAYAENESEEHKQCYVQREGLGLCDSSWQ